MKLILTIEATVGGDTNIIHIIDAVNETLNSLVTAGIIADPRDDAWEWAVNLNAD